ncbi:MAG: hypothetical protein ACI8ZM_004266 [Crocinitomix sp.]|jgi:hypothetical protein
MKSSKQHDMPSENNTMTLQKVVGIILFLMGAFNLYLFIDGLIGVKEIMRDRHVRYHYSEEDYLWSNILWTRHKLALQAFLLIIAGIALYKNRKIGWAIAWSTCLMIAVISSISLTIPYFDSGKVEIDARWYRLFFIASLNYLLTIIMLLPNFWRDYKIDWKVISIAIALIVLLVLDNQFYFRFL